MIYQLEGVLKEERGGFIIVGVGGVGYKVFVNERTKKGLSPEGTPLVLFCHHRVSETDASLYGFISEKELEFFELLLSVSGIGPKSALSILDVADITHLAATIQEGRPDLLMQASGIGRRTAERTIIELKDKVTAEFAEGTVKRMEGDADVIEALIHLGYRKDEARAALSKVEGTIVGIDARLKATLKLLQKK